MGAVPPHNKLSIVIGLIAIGLLASFELAWPTQEVSLCGIPFTLSGRTLLGLILLGLACTGTDAIVREHPSFQPQQLHCLFSHWILPAALTTVAWVLLAHLDSIRSQVIGVVVTSGLLAWLILAEYYTVDALGRWRAVVQLSLQLMAYLLGLLWYIAIDLNVPAGLAAAIAVTAASTILSLKLFSDNEDAMQRSWPHILGLGVLLGVISWLLRLWVTSPLSYSLILVVLLYVLAGIFRQFLLGSLTLNAVLEYLLIGVLALCLLLSYAR